MRSYHAAALVLLTAASSVHAEDRAVTPYRPSVSSPAQLSAAGQPELELGGLVANQLDGRRTSLPYAVKYAFSQEWGVVLGGEAWTVAPDGQGGKTRGIGDTSLVLKRAMPVSASMALGLELSAKFPTAAVAAGRDYGVNAIWSQDLDSDFHMDANLNAVHVGAVAVGAGRLQRGESVAFSHPLTEHDDAVLEWSANQRRGLDNTAQLLVAFSHSITSRLVVDVGVAKGLTSATPGWSFFTGVVFPLKR